MRTALVLALMTAACSSKPHIPEGTWVHNDDGGCALGLTTQAGSYTFQIMCTLQGTTVGDDVERGLVESTDRQLKLIPREASCPSSDHSEALYTYTFNGDRLALSDGTAIMVFKPVPTGSSTATPTVLLGCWNMGQFTEHAIQPL